ncbi:MAG: hypothetical protein CM1200mP2_35570 [Planctomycetaceae bacterium]|nr:MAG: hypothetical protein CM1200mP2_35570 [Planctomycetaceae bacterium]
MAKRRSPNPKPQPVKRRASTQGGRRRSSVASPVMAGTRFEQVSSLMISIVIGLVFATIVTFALWLSTVEAEEVGPAEMEMIELAGALMTGTRRDTEGGVARRGDEDPALTEGETDETEIEEVFENVVELSDNAAEQVEQQFETQAQNSGKVGSKAGTGAPRWGPAPAKGAFPGTRDGSFASPKAVRSPSTPSNSTSSASNSGLSSPRKNDSCTSRISAATRVSVAT